MKAHKYHARPALVDGIRFASQAESRRYGELKLLEKAGQITDLMLQPAFKLNAPAVGGVVNVGVYRGDFAYVTADGRSVIEDVKGVDLPLSKWKRKHVAAQYGVQVEIVRMRA